MHYPRLRNDRFSRTEPYEGVSSRMTTHKSLKTVKYSPYTDADEEKTPTHVINKVTSKIGGIFKGLQSAVGSFFKSTPSDLKESVTSENNPRKTTLNYPNVSNQAIKNIDFQGLAGLLAPANPMGTSFGEQQAEVNPMEVSFGEGDKNQNNSSGNQTIFTFKPTVANLSDSRIVEALDLNGSGFEQEPKMNILRILNFCHGLYENTKERYAKAKPYGSSLRSVLTKGLPKPVPVRSTTPLIEFKYNKVSGKYEAHSSFKKKKRTAGEADPDFDLKQHMHQSQTMMFEDQNQPEQHAYKKKRVSGLPKANTEAKIHVDLKKSKKKGPTNNVPSKKSASYGNTLETYETDETEEHELRKESPYKNKVFEEDKEDYFTKAEESRKRSPISSPVKGKDSVTSKDGTVASTNPFTSPIKSGKTTPEKIDTKQQNEKYQNLKITPIHEPSETNDAQKDTENILNLPKTPTFNLNPKNSLFNNSNSKSEDSIEQAPEEVVEPTETKPSSLFSQLPKSTGGLFSNLIKETPATVVASENKETVPVSNHNMSFSDEQPQAQPEPQVVEPAPVQQQQQQPQEVKVVPDFLKAYQRTGSVSSTAANVENNNSSSNPFLSRTASTVADTSNPFLKPAKTEAPMMSFLNNNNNNITVSSPQSNQTQTLPTVTSTLGLFNNNNSTTNNLFGNSGVSFMQNSPAPSLLEINSNSNAGSIFLKSSENSNGFDNTGGNIFHNNFQNDNEMEKESSMGFQNNLFANKSNNNNNLFGNNSFGGNSLFSNNNGMNNNISNNTNSLFASNNSSSQSTNYGMWNNNNNNASANNFMNNNNQSVNPFLSSNNNNASSNSFLSPPQNNKNPFTGGSMGGQQTQQAASNFLGIGASNSPAPQQERVFRKIIMPGSGNKKERAF